MSETKKKSRQELELLRDEALDAYLNREDFQYDVRGDALYRQYKDRYLDMGRNAMADTMGQAAALTGGYGSSYAQKVGQQAYDRYLQELGDVVPELYQLAYDRYQDRGSALYRTYEGWAKAAQEAVAQEQWEQEQARQQEQWQKEYEQEEQYRLAQQAQWQKEYEQAEQNRLAQQTQWQKEYEQEEQYRLAQQAQWQKEYEQAEQNRLAQQNRWQLEYERDEQNRLDQQEQWQKEFEEQQRQFDLQYQLSSQKASGSSGGRGGSSSGGSDADGSGNNYYTWLSAYQGKGSRSDPNDPTAVTKYDNQNVSTGNIMAMQRAIGVKETGMWTQETQRAAGGLEADAAWDAYTRGKLQIRQSVGQGDMNLSTGNIRTMERVLGHVEDGYWSDEDKKAAGGMNQFEAWEAYQRGKLQQYR